MQMSYVLLVLAICAVWFPSIPLGRDGKLPLWVVFFMFAIVAGLTSAVLQPFALLSLGALAASVWSSRRVVNKAWATALTCLAGLVALALSLHVFPGFHNMPLIVATRLMPDAAPFTQYLNFDKGAAGLLLLAAYARRCTVGAAWRAIALRTLVVMLATATAVLGTAVVTGYVRPELKLPSITLEFLATNLFFTCIAEEAFFRGLIQERVISFVEGKMPGKLLARFCSSEVAALWISVAISTLLFALAHISGGPLFVLLTAIAGLGYSVVYVWTRRIEAAVLTHFFVNAVHFMAFTYPYRAG
ncbi:MAG: amino terminal protease family protein [Rhodocyclales bacterium]|nr:amino terminal protease family protein [Rhodocyclales bacterium]